MLLSTVLVSAQTTITSQVSVWTDDAEERLSTGAVGVSSSDLELISDNGSNQLIGIRFQNITIPQGTTILSASIQFTTDEINSGATSLIIQGEDVDNSLTFDTTLNNISNRTTTNAALAVAWNNILAWNTVGEAGANQQTPDLTSIVQEIVNRSGWVSANAMTFIINGTGERTAESFNSSTNLGPVLTIVADFELDPLPNIAANPNRGLPFIYFIPDNQSELYSVAPDPSAVPLPLPTSITTTFGGNPIIFQGEGGGFRSTDKQVYVFQGDEGAPSSDLYSIDPSTGVSTLVKSDIVQGHVEGAEFVVNNATGEEIMVIIYQNGSIGGPNRLMAVNPNASGSNLAWSPYSGYPKVLSGARTQADGISWNPDTAEYYVQDDSNVDYYTIDITTGVTTFAFATSLVIDGEGITYASDGTNYIEDEGAAGLGRTIFIVDTDTGDLISAAQLASGGDVESIMGNLGVRNDAGDAPASYGYATHSLPVLTITPLTVYMGSAYPDAENPFVNYSIGIADDTNGDDEDGVTSNGTDLDNQLFIIGQTKSIDIETNGAGVLNAWIDFNKDGDFNDAGEQIATDVGPTSGAINLNVLTPLGAISGTSYARFRFSSEAGLASGNSEAVDGEVEDYRITIYDPTICPPGTALVETSSITHVYATTVIVDNSVTNQDNALGNDDTTLARFNNNADELILEMDELITNGDETTVNGTDGNVFDVWISASAAGPWTQVGNSAILDFTFTSPIDWQYIRLMRATGGNNYISYIDASKTVLTNSCEPDVDGDLVPDKSDLDNDNDGILDGDEASCIPYSYFGWMLNNPSGNLEVDLVSVPEITDWIISSFAGITSNGITIANPASDLRLSGITESTFEDAMASGHYVETAFTTASDIIDAHISNIQIGWYDPSLGDSYTVAELISDDDFATYTILSQDNFITDDGSGQLFTDLMDDSRFNLKANTTYTIRTYVYGHVDDSAQNYSVWDDHIVILKACQAIDSDNDGTSDHLDLDSDNDGIYDVIEAGHSEAQTNGVVNGAVGTDGVPNSVQASGQENSGTINYTIRDSDSDGNIDAIEPDADNDGCNDVIEAGYTDGNNDGLLGPIPITFDSNGVVTSGSDGYTIPEDADTSGSYDFQEIGTAPSITSQPSNQVTCPGCNAIFSSTASNSDTYQWQYFDGSNWTDLTNSGIYSGSDTDTLTLTNVSPVNNSDQYRVIASNSAFICTTETSNVVTLTLRVTTVITNRRITYRIKKN